MTRADELISDIVRKTYELESLGDLLISEAREMRRAGNGISATIDRLTVDDDQFDYSDGLQDVLDSLTNEVETEIRRQIDRLRDLARSVQ